MKPSLSARAFPQHCLGQTPKTPAVTGICQLQGLLSVEGLAAEPRPTLENDRARLPALIRNGYPAALSRHAQGLSWHRRPDSRKPGFWPGLLDSTPRCRQAKGGGINQSHRLNQLNPLILHEDRIRRTSANIHSPPELAQGTNNASRRVAAVDPAEPLPEHLPQFEPARQRGVHVQAYGLQRACGHGKEGLGSERAHRQQSRPQGFNPVFTDDLGCPMGGCG